MHPHRRRQARRSVASFGAGLAGVWPREVRADGKHRLRWTILQRRRSEAFEATARHGYGRGCGKSARCDPSDLAAHVIARRLLRVRGAKPLASLRTDSPAVSSRARFALMFQLNVERLRCVSDAVFRDGETASEPQSLGHVASCHHDVLQPDHDANASVAAVVLEPHINGALLGDYLVIERHDAAVVVEKVANKVVSSRRAALDPLRLVRRALEAAASAPIVPQHPHCRRYNTPDRDQRGSERSERDDGSLQAGLVVEEPLHPRRLSVGPTVERTLCDDLAVRRRRGRTMVRFVRPPHDPMLTRTRALTRHAAEVAFSRAAQDNEAVRH